jgi:hypothetical protein
MAKGFGLGVLGTPASFTTLAPFLKAGGDSEIVTVSLAL